MSSSSSQIRLSERGIEKFKDLRGKKWDYLYRDANAGKVPIEDLLQVITLAIFYRNEVEHPEWYTKQVAAGQSQL